MRRLLVALAVAALVASLSTFAWADDAEDAGTPPAESRTDPLPTGEPDDDSGFCGQVPWAVEIICDGVGRVIGWGVGAVTDSGVRAALRMMVAFVVDGASWLLGRVAGVIDSSTSPQLTAGWFQSAYRDMAVVAVLGLLPFLLLAIIQAVVRQDAGLLLRVTFGYVPLAAIATAGAVVVVDLLVQLTDLLSAWVTRSFASDLSEFATSLGMAVMGLAVASGGMGGLAALLAAGLVAFATFVIWLELLLRQAAIYVAVLFLPLGFMAMVWPATAHWLRRLVQGLVAIILSKFVIVAVMALAASALNAHVDEDGFGVIVAGGAMLSLAALAPYVLLKLIPVFDAGLSSQLEGTYRRPTAAVAPSAGSNQVVRLVRQRVGGNDQKGNPAGGGPSATADARGGPSGGPPVRPGGSGGGSSAGAAKSTAGATSGSGAAASAAAGGAAAVAAGAAGVRRAGRAAKQRADQGVAGAADGDRTARPVAPPSKPSPPGSSRPHAPNEPPRPGPPPDPGPGATTGRSGR